MRNFMLKEDETNMYRAHCARHTVRAEPLQRIHASLTRANNLLVRCNLTEAVGAVLLDPWFGIQRYGGRGSFRGHGTVDKTGYFDVTDRICVYDTNYLVSRSPFGLILIAILP